MRDEGKDYVYNYKKATHWHKKKNTTKRHVEINVPSLTIDKRFYNISVPNLKSIYKKSELNQLIT